MSGNVAEFTKTLYNSNYPEIYGGSYRSKADEVSKTSYFATCSNFSEWSSKYNTYTYSDVSYGKSYCGAAGIGFRLMLTCK